MPFTMQAGGGGGSSAGTVETLTDAATVTPSWSNIGGILTSLSQTTQIANFTGTPTNLSSVYVLRIKSASAQTLTFDTQFRGSADLALPGATSGSNLTDYLVFRWNSTGSKIDFVGRNFGF